MGVGAYVSEDQAMNPPKVDNLTEAEALSGFLRQFTLEETEAVLRYFEATERSEKNTAPTFKHFCGKNGVEYPEIIAKLREYRAALIAFRATQGATKK